MGATRERYRAPHCTQFGVDTTLNDCAVCALTVCLAYATLGEFVTGADGQEMGKAELHAIVRRMRRLIKDTEGGLDLMQVQEITRRLGFPVPQSVDISFSEMKTDLKRREFVYWLAGNPSNIKGSSPRKRCDCSHAWATTDFRVHDGQEQILLYDPLRQAGTRQRGEWVPAREIRQMGFKDSDGELNFVIRFPIGGYREAVLRTKSLRLEVTSLSLRNRSLADRVEARNTEIAGLTDQLRAVKNDLERCEASAPDCTVEVAAALRAERQEISTLVLARS